VPQGGPGEENERPLSAAGRDAARRLAAELAGAGIAAVYSSPYPRAVQTVEPLAAALGLDIAILDDLRERLLSPEALPDWEDRCRASWADPDHALPGGESGAIAQTRVLRVLGEIATRHRGETVAVASHGNLIALALAANDPSIGFDFWRSMPMPAVYRLERE
jgi:2,3-bisphosphoglycerate-dependent phosphoglycerate mutase